MNLLESYNETSFRIKVRITTYLYTSIAIINTMCETEKKPNSDMFYMALVLGHKNFQNVCVNPKHH